MSEAINSVKSTETVRRPVMNPMSMTNSMQPQCYANAFANQALFGGDDTFMGLGPIGMDSAFGCSPYGGSFGGGFPGQYGMGGRFGYGPGSEIMNMTQKEYMQHQEDIENYQIDKNVRQQHKIAAAGFRTTAAENNISRQIAVLQRKIRENEQDSVMKEYNKLVQATEEKLKEGGYIQEGTPRDQVKAEAERLYQEQTGKGLLDDLQEHGDNPFWYGMKQAATLGTVTNKRNYEDNVSDITGEDVSKTTEAWKWAGRAAGVVAGVATGIALLFGGARGLGELFKKGAVKA